MPFFNVLIVNRLPFLVCFVRGGVLRCSYRVLVADTSHEVRVNPARGGSAPQQARRER